METLALMIAFAALNRARGTQLFGLANSTSVGRVSATLGMGMACGLLALSDGRDAVTADLIGLWCWASLFFWCVWGWDYYFPVVNGSKPTLGGKGFVPVDWVLKKLRLPIMTPWQCKVWGLIGMTLRQSLAIVPIAGAAFIAGHPWHAIYGLGAFLIGTIYFVSGYARKKAPIACAEYATGAWIGLLSSLAIS